jgi:hypothetical protein
MIPCALYLRYSTDRQNERSPEDQEAVCRAYMERNGYSVVAVYVDRAKSGASVHERNDFQRMLADAASGLFQAVCAETTSRYGRDEERPRGGTQAPDVSRNRHHNVGRRRREPVDRWHKGGNRRAPIEDLKVMMHNAAVLCVPR